MNPATFLKSIKRDMVIVPKMIEKLLIINIEENRFDHQTLGAVKALKDMIGSYEGVCRAIKKEDLAINFKLLNLACDPMLEANQNPELITKENFWQYAKVIQKALKLAKEAVKEYNKAIKHL